MKKLFFLVVLGSVLFIGCSKSNFKTEQINETPCEEFHYSTCPARCIQICMPSACGPERFCTNDCDGPGSCTQPKN